MLTYIHGFNSSPASNTFRLLREAFPDAQALSYPSHGIFTNNLHSLRKQAEALPVSAASPLVLVGSSMGGFYASQLSALLGCNCALFNPVVQPARVLRRFLGRNVHFHTGETWELTAAMCDSYTAFPDTRTVPLRRFVVLGRNDDLLDPQEASAYWQGHAQFHETDDGHSLATLDEVTIAALKFLEYGQDLRRLRA